MILVKKIIVKNQNLAFCLVHDFVEFTIDEAVVFFFGIWKRLFSLREAIVRLSGVVLLVYGETLKCI